CRRSGQRPSCARARARGSRLDGSDRNIREDHSAPVTSAFLARATSSLECPARRQDVGLAARFVFAAAAVEEERATPSALARPTGRGTFVTPAVAEAGAQPERPRFWTASAAVVPRD